MADALIATPIWTSGWACGGPDYPDPHSNAKAFSVNADYAPDKSAGLADRFGWTNDDLSKRTMAAVREQDTATRQKMYEDIQREHTLISPFIYMFQEKTGRRPAGQRQGRGSGQHLRR
jgi:peptide/nickel transport system substrate-binding protein